MSVWDDEWQRLQREVLQTSSTASTRELEQAGVPRNVVYAWRDEGKLTEISRGVFRWTDASPVEHLDFVAVCKRAPHGTICLDSALARWDLIDDIPSQVHLAVPRGSTRPTIDYPSTHVHVFSPNTYDLGRQLERLSTGETYWIYSPPRSVIDALRMRKRYGGGPGLEALRAYLQTRGSSRRQLVELARALNVESALLRALEILG